MILIDLNLTINSEAKSKSTKKLHLELVFVCFCFCNENIKKTQRSYLVFRPVFTKLFRFRMKIRLKFQNELFLDYFPLSVQGNLIFVYIDIVNVVLDLK